VKVVVKPHERGALPAWVWVGVGLACAAGLGLTARLLPPGIIPPCGFRLVTGHPCPTCGATRMGWFLLEGNVSAALRMNPFLFFIVAGLGIWTAAGLAIRMSGRDLLLGISQREEKWWWSILVAGFLANWGYLWWAGI
jgi:hypothetical protein